jgi:hypothetical protein
MLDSKEEQADLYNAIFELLFNFSEPKEEKNLNKIVWTLIKPSLLKSCINYINGCKPKSSDAPSIPIIHNTNTNINKEDLNIKSKNRAKKKGKKIKNGEYENILLTETEFNKLVSKFGLDTTKAKIKEMDEKIEMKGYKYKSHYLAILDWDRRNKKNKSYKSSNEQVKETVEVLLNEINL